MCGNSWLQINPFARPSTKFLPMFVGKTPMLLGCLPRFLFNPFKSPFFAPMVNPPSSCLFRCKSHTWSRSLGASWSSGPFNFTALRKLNHPAAWWNGWTLYHIAKCSGTSYTWNMYKNQNFSHPGRKPLDSTVWLPKIGARDPAFEDQWLETFHPTTVE